MELGETLRGVRNCDNPKGLAAWGYVVMGDVGDG